MNKVLTKVKRDNRKTQERHHEKSLRRGNIEKELQAQRDKIATAQAGIDKLKKRHALLWRQYNKMKIMRSSG